MFIDTVSGRLLCMVCNKFRGKSTGSSDGISNLCLRFIAGHFPNIIWHLSIPPWTVSHNYIFFKLKTTKRIYTSMKGNAHQWLFRSLDLLSFRNLLCQLIAIQTLEKQGKLYSQLHWMKTSKVYFKRTLNSGKKELYVIVRQSSDRIRKAWQKWSPQQFRHQLRFPFRPDSFTPKNTQRKITPEFVTR